METIVSSEFQTKDWRKEQEWYKGGKSNECELYQRSLIKEITSAEVPKCNTRINVFENRLEDISHPNKSSNGFDYTEDFDGRQGNRFYNLKIICDKGGAQTRSLREVYHFVQAQINLQDNSKYFINILDGDCSFSVRDKFNFLLARNGNPSNVFVGDMLQFREWFSNTF